jgi:hypothetical protein
VWKKVEKGVCGRRCAWKKVEKGVRGRRWKKVCVCAHGSVGGEAVLEKYVCM